MRFGAVCVAPLLGGAACQPAAGGKLMIDEFNALHSGATAARLYPGIDAIAATRLLARHEIASGFRPRDADENHVMRAVTHADGEMPARHGESMRGNA